VPPARPERDPRTPQSQGRSAFNRIRRLLTKADECLEDADARPLGLFRAGVPHGVTATTRQAKEAVRKLYAHGDEAPTRESIERLVTDMADRDKPVEVRSLRRTFSRWTEHLVAWHPSHVSNGPTEAALIKRVKRAAFVFSLFRNLMLYAGKPGVAAARDLHIPLKSEAQLNFCSQICSGSYPILKFEQTPCMQTQDIDGST
jgi:hypothetical protein